MRACPGAGGGGPPPPRRFGLVDPPLTHVVCVGVGHHAQRLLEHLGIVVQPQHLHTGIGQAHDDAAAHGARADHGGGLDIEAGLAHVNGPRRRLEKVETNHRRRRYYF